MKSKKVQRLRRARKTRKIIEKLKVNRLTVTRTNLHIYANIISECGKKVLISASSLEPDIKAQIKNGGNIKNAGLIGERIAKKAISKGITKVAFDRSGYAYHGRVKALAQAAREFGLEF